MAGRPKTRSFMAELQRRADRDTSPDAPLASALDWVCDYIASGETFRSLAAELDVTSGTLRRALDLKFGKDEVKARLADARLHGGHSLADKAIERSQNIEDKDDAAAARVEVGAYQWTAERWNREQYGAAPKVAVGVQVGLPQQHLEALRQLARRDRQQKALTAEVIEVNGVPSAPGDPTRAFLDAPQSDNRADTSTESAA